MAIESEPYAYKTLTINQAKRRQASRDRRYLQGTRIIQDDVRRVPGRRVLRELGAKPGELDVVCGGPPCVSFSVAGPRQGLGSEAGRLFEAYARMLRTLRPKAFIFENVRGLLTAVNERGEVGGAWAVISRRLEDAGYRISSALLNAADFGVPQHRERLFVVGLRGHLGEPFEFPSRTHCDPTNAFEEGLHPWLTVRDAIADLPFAPVDPGEAAVLNHVARRHRPATLVSFAATPGGARNATFKRDRLRWERPATVIRAQGKPKRASTGRHSSHQAIHPTLPRQLTVRECARIQSFPDWYEFPSTFSNGYRVVGDAVPPRLAATVGRELLAHFRSATKQGAARRAA